MNTILPKQRNNTMLGPTRILVRLSEAEKRFQDKILKAVAKTGLITKGDRADRGSISQLDLWLRTS